MSKLKALRKLFTKGFDKFGEEFGNSMSRTARTLDKGLDGIQKRAQREVDLIKRPGRAHGYENPVGKTPRTRAQGHEVYTKALGVPGFKTRAHHNYIQGRRRLHIAGAVTAAVITGYGIDETTKYLAKASDSEKTARNQRLRSLKKSSKVMGIPWNIQHSKDSFTGSWPTGIINSKDPTASPFKKRLNNVVEDSFKKKKR